MARSDRMACCESLRTSRQACCPSACSGGKSHSLVAPVAVLNQSHQRGGDVGVLHGEADGQVWQASSPCLSCLHSLVACLPHLLGRRVPLWRPLRQHDLLQLVGIRLCSLKAQAAAAASAACTASGHVSHTSLGAGFHSGGPCISTEGQHTIILVQYLLDRDCAGWCWSCAPHLP